MTSQPHSPHCSPSFDKPFSLTFRASRALVSILLFMHGGALVALTLTPMAVALRAPLALLVLISLVYSVRLQGLRQGKGAVLALYADANGYKIKIAGSGELRQVLIRAQFVHPYAVVLALRAVEDAKQYPLVVLRDAADTAGFQHWRARLNTRVDSV